MLEREGRKGKELRERNKNQQREREREKGREERKREHSAIVWTSPENDSKLQLRSM